MKSNAFQLSDAMKNYPSKQVIPRTNSLEKKVFTVDTFKRLWVVSFYKNKRTFGILWYGWVSFALLEVRGPNKYCLWVTNLVF